jgi:hypothetical protein
MKLQLDPAENSRLWIGLYRPKRRLFVGFSVLMCLSFAGAAWGQSDHALKPSASEAIQFVSHTGNDKNDGLSWGSAKLTIFAAYQALPSYACNFGPRCGGTIHLGDGVIWGGPIVGQGLRILGVHDPNFKSPPAGWLREKTTTFVCDATGSHASTGNGPACLVTGNNDSNPGLWISGNASSMEFDGLKIMTGSMGALLSQDSNGVFENNAAVTNVTFHHCAFSSSNSDSTKGPGMLIGPNSFQIYLDGDIFDGNPSAAGGTEKRQGLVIDPGKDSNNNSGAVYLYNSHINGGGFEINTHAQGASGVTVNGLVTEGQTDGHAAVWILYTDVNSSYNIQNVTVADAYPFSPGVEVDGDGPIDAVMVSGVSEAVGRATVVNVAPASTQLLVVSPNRQHQTGFINGHVLGQIDSSRRSFGPAAVRFMNLSPTAPVSWTVNGTAVVTRGVTAPDGTTGAAACSTPSSSGACFFYNANQTYSVGDIVILGVWGRAENALGFNGAHVFSFSAPFCGRSCVFKDLSGQGAFRGFVNQFITGDGIANKPPAQWDWYWTVLKVDATSNSPTQTQFAAPVSNKSPADYYAPVFLHIRAGALSDNEATELALNLQSYGSSCAVGTICGLPGQTEAPSHLGQMAANQFAGTTTLSNGMATVTFPVPFHSSPVCIANDTSSASAGIKPAPTATKVVFSGAGTDSIAYICIGNPD